ncbi:MAG: IS630 family transposase [Candidatus Dormibacteria bacterium]
MPHAPAPALLLTADQRSRLELWSRSRTLPQREVQRARVILLAAEGRPNTEIGRQVGCSKPTVLLWRARFCRGGLAGLEDAPGRGRPAVLGKELSQRVLSTTMSPPPKGHSHWSSRQVAEVLGVSATTVRTIWRQHRLQPHRSRTFKFSQDPDLASKVTDVVGLYLHPPEKAVVLSVDEKSQIQALDRTQPLLPMRPGQVERRTHDYVRHGTTTLFAALDVATGEVTGRCYAHHRHQEFLRFLRLVARSYPRGQIHLVLDNYATHKHPEVQLWLLRHPRFHLHFTPTSASWMNQVECWFSILHRQAIRRGVFQSLAALRLAIQRFLDAWNDQKHPFAWVKTPDQILARANRQAISGSLH